MSKPEESLGDAALNLATAVLGLILASWLAAPRSQPAKAPLAPTRPSAILEW